MIKWHPEAACWMVATCRSQHFNTLREVKTLEVRPIKQMNLFNIFIIGKWFGI